MVLGARSYLSKRAGRMNFVRRARGEMPIAFRVRSDVWAHPGCVIFRSAQSGHARDKAALDPSGANGPNRLRSPSCAESEKSRSRSDLPAVGPFVHDSSNAENQGGDQGVDPDVFA